MILCIRRSILSRESHFLTVLISVPVSCVFNSITNTIVVSIVAISIQISVGISIIVTAILAAIFVTNISIAAAISIAIAVVVWLKGVISMTRKFHTSISSVWNLLGALTNCFHSCFRSDHRHWKLHSRCHFHYRYFHYRCSCHSCLQYLRFRLNSHFHRHCCLKTDNVRLGFNLRAYSCGVKKTSTSLTVSVQVSIRIASIVQTVKIPIAITYTFNKYMNGKSICDSIWS